MKHLIVIATVLGSTSLFSMETEHKHYVIFKNLLPQQIDVLTKGENIVDFYPKKKYIHYPDKVTASIVPGGTAMIFLEPKTSKDQLGLSENGNIAVVNLYMHSFNNQSPVRLYVYRERNQQYIAATIHFYVYKHRPWKELEKDVHLYNKSIRYGARHLIIHCGEGLDAFPPRYPSMTMCLPYKKELTDKREKNNQMVSFKKD